MNPKTDSNGVKKWYNKEGKLHREDGPAIIRPNNDREWLISGKLHRTDGPAATRTNGTKEWFQNGELHRTDGPALEYADGTKYWFLNDNELPEDLFKKLTQCPYEDLPLMLGMGFDKYIAERLKGL